MWGAKKKFKALEKRVADLEAWIQSQQIDEEEAAKALELAKELMENWKK